MVSVSNFTSVCSDSWGTRSSLLIALCKLGFVVD